jgi:hypothetical protein
MHDMKPACVSLLAVVLSLLWPAALQANDTMAVFAAGGLQFQQTNELRMEREELYLSDREVRVDYVFRNITNRDVRGRVAFPMPEIHVGDMSETPHEFHKSKRDGDIFRFRVEVDGVEVTSDFQARAYVKADDGTEKDVTELLQKYQILLVDPDFRVAPKELIAAGAIDEDGEHPTWWVRPIFHWDQVFPAGKAIRVKHSYKPVLGGTTHQTRGSGPVEFMAPWCPDKAFYQGIKKLPARYDGTLRVEWLEYILKTGANWAGPIGTFRLEIDKAGADLVSLCPIPGLKLERRGKTFVAEASQYTPTSDIKLLFAYRACDKAPCN